jgi:hypothetical protein
MQPRRPRGTDIAVRRRRRKRKAARSESTRASDAEPKGARGTITPGTTTATRVDGSAHVQLRSTAAVPEARASDACQLLTPNVLSVKHWNRLVGGALYATTPGLDWASLLRRSFQVDVLACAACGGRLRVLGEVTEPGRACSRAFACLRTRPASPAHGIRPSCSESTGGSSAPRRPGGTRVPWTRTTWVRQFR